MRIGMISSHPEGYGGVQTHVHFLSNQLINMNNEVYVFTTKKIHNRQLKNKKYKIYDTQISINYWNFFFKYPRFRRYIKMKSDEIGIDIYHAHFGLPFGLSIPKSNPKKLITCHGSGLSWTGWKKPLKLLTNRVLKHADHIVCVSDYLRQIIRSEYPNIPEKRISVIFNGVNLNPYSKKGKIELRKEIGFTERDFIILYVGTLESRKNPLLLLNAFKEINKKYNHIKLVMVGQGPLKEDIENIISNIKQIRLLTKIPEDNLARLYATSDVFVLPSKFEPFGIVFLEAMIAGLPVICTNACGISEVITENKSGYLIKNEDKDDLIEKIEILINDEELRKQIEKNNIRNATKNFSWKTITKQYLEIYKHLK